MTKDQLADQPKTSTCVGTPISDNFPLVQEVNRLFAHRIQGIQQAGIRLALFNIAPTFAEVRQVYLDCFTKGQQKQQDCRTCLSFLSASTNLGILYPDGRVESALWASSVLPEGHQLSAFATWVDQRTKTSILNRTSCNDPTAVLTRATYSEAKVVDKPEAIYAPCYQRSFRHYSLERAQLRFADVLHHSVNLRKLHNRLDRWAAEWQNGLYAKACGRYGESTVAGIERMMTAMCQQDDPRRKLAYAAYFSPSDAALLEQAFRHLVTNERRGDYSRLFVLPG